MNEVEYYLIMKTNEIKIGILERLFERQDLQLAITLNPSLDKILQAMDEFANQKTEWIDVNERLPENRTLVHVYNFQCNPEYSHAYMFRGEWMNPYTQKKLNPTPTHWMPLPPKP